MRLDQSVWGTRDQHWALAIAALSVVALVLVGGLGPLPSIPIAAFLTAAASLVAGVARIRGGQSSEPFFAASVALALIALVSAAFVLLLIAPCGADCL